MRQKYNMSAAKTCAFLWTFTCIGFVLTGADPCSNNPCKHDGLCTVKGNEFSCSCPRSWAGPTCAIDINPCRSHPCKNGATCFRLRNLERGGYTCLCRPGFEGEHCDGNGDDKMTTYKAAVFDFEPVYLADDSKVLSRPDAIKFMTKTLDIFEDQCKQAYSKGVHIIVFPEYGLAPALLAGRDVMEAFMEVVPDPKKIDWNPCNDPKRFKNTEFQQRLSCMAKKYHMFVVANMGSIKSCKPSNITGCNADGRWQWNTNVAYDWDGKHVAKYRKRHPFFLEAKTYDRAKMIDYAAFDTPFGKFGTFICFDILFKEPAITLIEKWNLDSVAFPTAWVNVLPYFSATPFHGSFATAMSINFLASNLHIPTLGATGSGIYTPGKTMIYRNIHAHSGSKLLISELPVKPRQIKQKKVTFSPSLKPTKDFVSKIFGDDYNFVKLTGRKGVAFTCHGGLCCRLEYKYKNKDPNEFYAVGAFEGLHYLEGTYYLQMCLLLKCGNMSGSSCGETVSEANTRFSLMKMAGNFTTPYVHPSMVTSGVDPSNGEFTYNGKGMTSRGTKKGLIAAVFLARKYDLDTPKVHKRSLADIDEAVARARADPDVLSREFLDVE